jgi:Uma2 family endonuclease
MQSSARKAAEGPFFAAHIREGDPYELSNGHPIYCAPGGGTHAGPNEVGAQVVASDPSVKEVGIDAGYTPEPKMLRAPDVAVGNVPNKPGWIQGVPDLALEYADVGQDEEDLQDKIGVFLKHGTQQVWVVRLTGPRRVEVYRRGQAMQVVLPGAYLIAPGILKNPVLVESLYDRDAADRATLTNLLQRRGYADLEAVLQEGRAEGALAQARTALRLVLQTRGLEVSPEGEARIAACSDLARLDTWLARAIDARALTDVFDAD